LEKRLRASFFLRETVGNEGAEHVSLDFLIWAKTLCDDFFGNAD
jgi:hypothetical protein